MAHARRSLRNHHGKPHEHAPGDPLGEYLPPLADWGGRGKSKTWWHPMLGWKFTIIDDGARVNGYVQLAPDGRDPYVILVRPNGKPMPMSFHFPTRDEQSTYAWMKDWYSRLNVREMAMADGSPLRLSARNPDWSAIRAKATHYGSRAATGAREAYAWTAPRAKRAAEVTWEGAKSAGRVVKRGAKRAAPVVARGARSAAEGLDRWSQTNGRCAMRNGAVLPPPKTSNFHVNGMHFRVVSMDYPDGGHATTVTVWESRPGSSHRHPHLALRDLHKSMGGREAGNSIVWGRAIDEKRLREVAEKVTR